MATVDLAVDLELEREVALKRLHPHLVTDQMVDRFRREAQAAARLRHPGVVTIHDWGFDDDTPYLVMEVIEGPSLRTALTRRGRLAPGEALAVLAPAVAGLAAAHRAGIVHRDVTPGNVLLGRDGASKMADFGLARPMASCDGDGARRGGRLAPLPLTGGRTWGPPGCTLRRLLAGLRALRVPDRPPTLRRRHRRGDRDAAAQRAGAATQRRGRRGLPRGLDEVVLAATEPDPDDRYADAEDLLADLHDAVPDGPGPGGPARRLRPDRGDPRARHPGAGRPRRQPRRRRRAAARSAAGPSCAGCWSACCSAAAAGSRSTSGSRRSPRARRSSGLRASEARASARGRRIPRPGRRRARLRP